MSDGAPKPFHFEISLSVLNHLGRNLYRNFITVIAEAVSNSWDAEAQNVWIEIDKEGNTFSIKDDGLGMTAEDFQEKFLKIGYSKRKDGKKATDRGRPFIGAKGIGKLALLSCANRVSIYSKTTGAGYVGGVIDNADLDKAIKSDNTADQYPLEQPDLGRIEKLQQGHEHGTIIVFDATKEKLRSSPAHIRKMLAMSFKFSLHDKAFKIFVDGTEVSEADLGDLARATEFLWIVNGYTDGYVAALDRLKSSAVPKTTKLGIRGFLATVEKPRHLKITGTDERATVDLIVNGRIREKNLLRHIPTQRIVESYLYGQLHFDTMDREGTDPFTSSREGVVEDDIQFQSLMDYLKRDLLPQIIDEWDGLRLDRGLEGDDENNRKTKKERKARELFSAAKDDYKLEDAEPNKDKVDRWLESLRDDAQYNLQAYADCFLSENLIRKYLVEKSIPLTPIATKDAADWKRRESENLKKANISWAIRTADDDLYYIDMDGLAVMAEGSKSPQGPSLWLDAVNYKPVRNAVGHTGLLSAAGKTHLNQVFQNVRARIKNLLTRP
ncbi:Histidine kinase-, DNA gyrase B-, and HSP90-like ATPase [Albimonas donghaensis]|uniref:Histidine kinase-, DNA gyrase B-, and HSP90-like ATPase n=1 Tax=Albimonas donghaensis TaxID=356660 RepID=A0A1H2RC27_9RHOB|nr:Histidine kinase-, DNA gyrase B-, and HSP90-like ATPase [Albimonas donghaensis]